MDSEDRTRTGAEAIRQAAAVDRPSAEENDMRTVASGWAAFKFCCQREKKTKARWGRMGVGAGKTRTTVLGTRGPSLGGGAMSGPGPVALRACRRIFLSTIVL